MATFYVPVERKAFPAGDPLRWFILEVETTDPISARMEAARTACEVMRVKGAAVWAAVRDCPSFAYMQMLRECLDACRHARGGRKLGPIGSSIPGYV